MWTTRNSPVSMRQLPVHVRRKALAIANILFARGYEERSAVMIATSMAREWAEHDKTMRERQIHVLPRENGWAVCRIREPQRELVFDQKGAALAFAVDLARTEAAIVIAHSDSGEVEGHIRVPCPARAVSRSV
jgi:hypothetical protein